MILGYASKDAAFEVARLLRGFLENFSDKVTTQDSYIKT